MFSLIDFGDRLRNCPGWRSQLTKPSVLGNAFFKIVSVPQNCHGKLIITLQNCLVFAEFVEEFGPDKWL